MITHAKWPYATLTVVKNANPHASLSNSMHVLMSKHKHEHEHEHETATCSARCHVWTRLMKLTWLSL